MQIPQIWLPGQASGPLWSVVLAAAFGLFSKREIAHLSNMIWEVLTLLPTHTLSL